MSTLVRFFTLCVVDEEQRVTNCSLKDLLNGMESKLKNTDIIKDTKIGKKIRFFKYLRPEMNSKDSFIVPFGTLKLGVTYKQSASLSSDVEEINPKTEKLYDVTFLFYDSRRKVAFMTQDKASPSYKAIQDYLNCLIDNDRYKLCIEPILCERGLSNIKASNCVKSVNITLDLASNIEEMIIDENQQNIVRNIRDFANKSRNDMLANKLVLSLSIGKKGTKDASMSKENILELISQLNIDDEAIREIEVAYKNGRTEKMEKARIKDSKFGLSYSFDSCPGSTLTSSFILDNSEIALHEKQNEYSSQITKSLKIHKISL